jgi:phage nucleotide-binding protein
MEIIKGGQNSNRFLKMVVYGSSGVGKTVFASTAPNAIFLNAEAGMLSIADKNIDSVEVKSFADIRQSFDFLKNEKHNYKTVVIDSLTEVQKKSMDLILESRGKEQPTIADWGSNIEQIRKMCRQFRDLPMNVIFIALERTDKDSDEAVNSKMPALQGATLPQEVMGFVDIVGYMQAQEKIEEATKEKKIVRAIRVQPSQTIIAKDRSGKLDIWEQPNFETIYNKIFSRETVEEIFKRDVKKTLEQIEKGEIRNVNKKIN